MTPDSHLAVEAGIKTGIKGSIAVNDRAAKVMTMKILWEKGSKRLLGAQIIGADGVDKRIDVLAAAMAAGITAPQLAELDLAYAPPYSSAKDPVNMAGFMIENIVNGKVSQFFREEADALPRDGSLNLVDVRTEGEYRFGHLEGFQNIRWIS